MLSHKRQRFAAGLSSSIQISKGFHPGVKTSKCQMMVDLNGLATKLNKGQTKQQSQILSMISNFCPKSDILKHQSSIFNRINQSEKNDISHLNLQFRDILASFIPAVSTLPFSRAVWVELAGVKILLVRITYVGEVLMTTFAKLFNLIQVEDE